MTLALPDKWIWDTWYVRDKGLYHCFFLQANKSLNDPDLRHFNVTQGHATSRDLKTWTHLGTCFEPAANYANRDWWHGRCAASGLFRHDWCRCRTDARGRQGP